ncbi:TetR/AcrR family transcriptional regulator [Rhodococcus xishaensis]|uniref:TetR/AcrR family transcriptional regulator n=1 Tax=Rhodococcus xishaensis TaxID=2487364 RepID=A0A438AZL2_9NOCA|nr:TetR/AcrR family transcriptional regulator [Rhodococcus xishaensis]RVW04133.1 TetR/AcrR family transcriptional regulator [Rhodococcus xishaensis]
MPRYIDVGGLFDTTVAVFAERGYRATTTQEIASRAGVNEATLFRRYGDKATLISTALTQVLAKAPFAHVTTTDDVTADLVALATAFAETNRMHGGAVGTLLVEMQRHPELRAATDTFMPNLLNAVHVIATHQDRGQLAPGDPVQKLLILLAPLMLFGMLARSGAESIVAEFDPNTLVATFLDGHRAS